MGGLNPTRADLPSGRVRAYTVLTSGRTAIDRKMPGIFPSQADNIPVLVVSFHAVAKEENVPVRC